jgi:hypothetical protein
MVSELGRPKLRMRSIHILLTPGHLCSAVLHYRITCVPYSGGGTPEILQDFHVYSSLRHLSHLMPNWPFQIELLAIIYREKKRSIEEENKRQVRHHLVAFLKGRTLSSAESFAKPSTHVPLPRD